jgi:hypothetical protein
VPISLLLDDEEMAELTALKLTLDAQEREQDRRKAAIDRDRRQGASGRGFPKRADRRCPLGGVGGVGRRVSRISSARLTLFQVGLRALGIRHQFVLFRGAACALET